MKHPHILKIAFFSLVATLWLCGFYHFASALSAPEALPDAQLLESKRFASQNLLKLKGRQKALVQNNEDLQAKISRLKSDNVRLHREKSIFNSKGKRLVTNQAELKNLEALLPQLQHDLKAMDTRSIAYAKYIRAIDAEIRQRSQDKFYTLGDTVDRYDTDFLENAKGAYQRNSNRLALQLTSFKKVLEEQQKKSKDPLDEKIQSLNQNIEAIEKQFNATSFTLQSIDGELQRRLGKKNTATEGDDDLTFSAEGPAKIDAVPKKGFEHFRGFFREDLEKEFAQRQEKEKKNVFYLSIGSIAALVISFLFLKKTFS